MRKINTWHGIDVSNEESLFEYGFLIRWNAKNKMYDGIFAIGYDDNGNADTFVYDSWDADYWREELADDESDLKGICDMCGLTYDTYLADTSDANLLNDLIAYGLCSEIGEYKKKHTTMEVRKRLNRALY